MKNNNLKKDLEKIILVCIVLSLGIFLLNSAAKAQPRQDCHTILCNLTVLDLFAGIGILLLIPIVIILIVSIILLIIENIKKDDNNVKNAKIETSGKQNNITTSQKIPGEYKMKFVDYFFISYVATCAVLNFLINILGYLDVKQILDIVDIIMPNNFRSELLVILIFALIPAFISAFIITKIKNKTKK